MSITFSRNGFGMKDNFLYSFSVFCMNLIPFIFGIFIRRIVLPEIIGAFAFVNSITIIFNMPNSILRNAVGRLVPKYRGKDDSNSANKISSISLSILLIIIIIEVLLLCAIGFFFRGDTWQFYAFFVSAIVFGLGNINYFFQMYIKSLNRIKESAYLRLILPIFSPLLYLIVYLFRNVGFYLGKVIISPIVSLLIIHFSVKQISWGNIKPVFKDIKNLRFNPLFKEIIHTGSLLFFYGLLFQLLFNIDKYFVKFLEGNTMLAFYSFTTLCMTKVLLILQAFIGSFSPKIYTNFTAKKNQEYLFTKITYITIIGSYLSAFLIFIFSNYFINLILPNYIQSVSFFRILIFMIIPLSQYNIGYIIAVGRNKITPLLKGMSIVLILAVFLNWLLYNFYGIYGIAWATVISAFLSYVIISFIIFKEYYLWYLTLIFLPVLTINFWLVSYNIMLASVFFIIVISICLYFLILSSHRRKEIQK